MFGRARRRPHSHRLTCRCAAPVLRGVVHGDFGDVTGAMPVVSGFGGGLAGHDLNGWIADALRFYSLEFPRPLRHDLTLRDGNAGLQFAGRLGVYRS